MKRLFAIVVCVLFPVSAYGDAYDDVFKWLQSREKTPEKNPSEFPALNTEQAINLYFKNRHRDQIEEIRRYKKKIYIVVWTLL